MVSLWILIPLAVIVYLALSVIVGVIQGVVGALLAYWRWKKGV